jgi:2'-5' RNA ligase
MPAPGTQLYLLAIIPPSPVCEEIQSFKEYFKVHYQSKASLNSPPHITLHMPFQWKTQKEEKLITGLKQFVSDKQSFKVTLQNFACFYHRVIYVNVLPNNSLFEIQAQLHRFCKTTLNLFNARYQDLPFHPHITVAFRDLKKEKFDAAWSEFEKKEYHTLFNVDRIILLKQHDKEWQVFREFIFNC